MTRKIKTGTETEWREFGREIHEIRRQLIETLLKYQHLIPLKVTDRGFKAVKWLDQFRCDAEEEMFRRGGPKDIKVFYPGDGKED